MFSTPQNAAEALREWDEGAVVTSLAMGGFGPGYEQAIQIAMFEGLRLLQKETFRGYELGDRINLVCENIGLSGSQVSAAANLASCFHHDYVKTLAEATDDRKIYVTKNFPQLEDKRSESQKEWEELNKKLNHYRSGSENFSKVCSRFQELLQKYNLGSLGQDIFESVINEIESLIEEKEFIYNQVERGLYCAHQSEKTALINIAHYPSAPWNSKKRTWDVDHKEYAEEFYNDFPKAKEGR